MALYSPEALITFGTNILTAKGLSEDLARYISTHAVDTEAMGITTHGLNALNAACSMVPDTVEADTAPVIIKETPGSILIDAQAGLSQPAMRMAMDACRDKARSNGIAMAAIRNGRWIGALGTYVLDLAKDGFFAQAWAQSSQCKDCAPVGGLDPKFSTNPMAIAFPTHEDPVFADQSTAAVSMGKLNQLARDGKKAADAIFMDKDGTPSADPGVFKAGGSILFTGGAEYGHKGYALSLWAEALTAMAGGSCNNPDLEQRQALNLTVIDPEAFGGMDYFGNEIERFLKHMKDSRLRPGYAEIRLPGQRSLAARSTSYADGLELPALIKERLNQHAEAAGIDQLQ